MEKWKAEAGNDEDRERKDELETEQLSKTWADWK